MLNMCRQTILGGTERVCGPNHFLVDAWLGLGFRALGFKGVCSVRPPPPPAK